MAKFYELEVHFLDYDTVGITADSEEEAHERAKAMYEQTHGHIIGVKAVGTVAIDRIEVPNEHGERTTEYE